jgi:Tol biopolymer transport system component
MGGSIEALSLPPGPIENHDLSPDGTRIVAQVEEGGGSQIAIYTIDRGTRQWLTPDDRQYHDPFWSPDGEWIYFTDDRGVYRARSNFSGTIETVTSDIPYASLGGIANDGRTAGVSFRVDATAGRDVAVLDLDTGELRAAMNTTDTNEFDARISPDGRLIAYVGWEESGTGGSFRAYVRDLETSEFQVVSPGIGQDPTWTRDGSSLLFVDGNNEVWRSVIGREPALTVGVPEPLFRREANREGTLVPSLDDSRLLALVALPAAGPAGDGSPRIEVILGWANEVARRVRPRDDR